jgi:nucleoid-associated protein YgaU
MGAAMTTSIYSRYYKTALIEIEGRLTRAQRLPAPPGEYTDSLVHRIVGNETLDQLAKKYYGREELWWRIADANQAKFPWDWQAGDVLIIPPIRVATRIPRR